MRDLLNLIVTCFTISFSPFFNKRQC